MNACDVMLGATGVVALSQTAVDAAAARIAALPLADLVTAWRVVQSTGYPEQTPAIWAFRMYFDGLGVDDPERCVDFVQALMRDEDSDELVALAFDGKLVPQLATFSLAKIADRLEAAASGSERWSRMLGAAYWSLEHAVGQQGCGKALLAIADRAAFQEWDEARKRGRSEVDFAILTLPDLARWWIDLNAASPVERERDDNASNLFNHQCHLAGDDPERAFGLVREVLAATDDPALLGLLAAGLLEDCLPAKDGPELDRLIAEADRDPRFRRLLAGVYTSGIEPEAAARIEAAVGRSPSPA